MSDEQPKTDGATLVSAPESMRRKVISEIIREIASRTSEANGFVIFKEASRTGLWAALITSGVLSILALVLAIVALCQ